MKTQEPKEQISVYIVDSHVLVRQMLINITRTTHELKLLGSTSGKDPEGVFRAVMKLSPDVLIMGIDRRDSEEMKLFRAIRKKVPQLPIVVAAPLNEEGGQTVFEALRYGAVDYLTLPDRHVNIPVAKKHFLKRLVPMLRAIPRVNTEILTSGNLWTSRENSDSAESVSRDTDLMIMSGCMGGVHSFMRLIPTLPSDLPVPVVILQHMPSPYTKIFADLLNERTDLNVVEADNTSRLKKGRIHLVPGGTHAVVRRYGSELSLQLHRGPREHRCRPSIDVLLRSAAYCTAERTLAVLLSGGGLDGIEGARAIHRARGRILLEARSSALLWDLPRRILREGMADGVGATDQLSRQISRQLKIDTARRILPTYRISQEAVLF